MSPAERIMVRITGVAHRSLAERAGLRAGDFLISINAHDINDVLDYRFYLTEKRVVLLFCRGEKEHRAEIVKEEYEDIGLEFETPLMDQKLSCKNKCIFCFIDQLPKGMRETLYFKDDDARLSFLHGNYITLTNLKDEDIDRIIKMRISPINISVHTTNPDLRCKMMKNKRAGEVLSYLNKLSRAGISLNCQIVLCRGVNDGVELERTMHDLAGLYPALESVSIVPAGLTAHREGLYPLEPFTPEECALIIKMVDLFAEGCRRVYGRRLFYCADEFFVKCGRTPPDADYYEGYPQLENGVGLITDLRDDFEVELESIEKYLEKYRLKHGDAVRRVSLVTGDAAFDFICTLIEKLEERCYNIKVKVYKIKNNFFGESITVAGLITGVDIAAQLSGTELCDELLVPAVSLRADRDLFLCGMTPEELSGALDVPVRIVEKGGASLIGAILDIDPLDD